MHSKALLLLALIGTAAQSKAATAISFTGYTSTYTDGIDRVIGWDFTTLSTPLHLTSLSFFDAGGDGLAASHMVALYETSTQNLIASVTIPAGTAAALDGNFRTVPVSSTLLAPNTSYTLAATWTGGSDPWVWDDGLLGVDMTGFSTFSGISTGTTPGRYLPFTSTLAFPATQIGDSRNWFVGPNAGLSVVPEPGRTWMVMAPAMSLMLKRRRSRTAG